MSRDVTLCNRHGKVIYQQASERLIDAAMEFDEYTMRSEVTRILTQELRPDALTSYAPLTFEIHACFEEDGLLEYLLTFNITTSMSGVQVSTRQLLNKDLPVIWRDEYGLS